MENDNNENLEKRVEHIMITKIQFWVAIIVFVIPVIAFFFKIQLDITLIKQNHEAHMQIALEKIADLEKEQVNLMKKLDTDHEAIIRLLQMHEK